MIYLYTRIFFDRNKREFFEKFKMAGVSKKTFAAEKLLECAKKRKISAFKLWLQEAKRRRDEQNKKRGYYVECAKRLLSATENKQKSAFDNWRGNAAALKRI